MSRAQIIFVSDNHYPKTKLPLSARPLRRIHHKNVGDATSFAALTSTYNLVISPTTSKIRRTVKHFIDFSLRLRHYDPLMLTYPSFVVPHFPLLPVSKWTPPVWYPSSFSRTGFGSRPLTPTELGLMFGLSTHLCRHCSMSNFPFPPVQVFDSLLRPSLEPRTDSPSGSMLVLPTQLLTASTFFPQFGKHLPHSWAYVDYTADKAAKNDNASPFFSRHMLL